MVINCKKIFTKKSRKIASQVKKLSSAPQLDIIYIKKNIASELYIKKKAEVAEKLGIKIKTHIFKRTINPENIVATCNALNQDPNCTGYFVQLPIKKKFKDAEILEFISPAKDVDGLTSTNLGKVVKNSNSVVLPATVEAILAVISKTRLRIKSKNIAIINDSNLIGKPLAAYLLNKGATVTVCNEYTKDLKQHTQKAEILITATGKANLIKSDMVNEDAIVIDVGMTKVKGKVRGDVDFENVSKKVKAITPVPGGVGPLTVICLFENLLKLQKLQRKAAQ